MGFANISAFSPLMQADETMFSVEFWRKTHLVSWTTGRVKHVLVPSLKFT
jgi:hypothetical protein